MVFHKHCYTLLFPGSSSFVLFPLPRIHFPEVKCVAGAARINPEHRAANPLKRACEGRVSFSKRKGTGEREKRGECAGRGSGKSREKAAFQQCDEIGNEGCDGILVLL